MIMNDDPLIVSEEPPIISEDPHISVEPHIISEDHSKSLVNTINENCRVVEELALETVSSQHMPLLNSTLCFTEQDCRDILEKCHVHHLNVVEHLIVLIAVTDFISCVCTNSETFPLSRKRNDKRSIKIILQMLQKNWCKVLSNLTSNDISANHLTNIMKITKRCMERMLKKEHKIFLEIILKLQEKALSALINPPGVCHQQSLKPEPLAIPRKKHVQHRKITAMTLTDTQDFTSVKTTHAPKSIPKIKESKKEKKGKLKKSCDIMKFILKPCENIMMEESNEQTRKTLPRKRKLKEIEEADTDKLGKELSEENLINFKNIRSPSLKKHCVQDDLIDGKVNAFKMLMKPLKHVKSKITKQCK